MSLLRRVSIAATAAALCVAWSAPAVAAPSAPDTPSAVVVEVQTYNLYIGADLTPLFAASNPVVAASMVWAEMQVSDIPARARAVAEVLADEEPDLVGLQEVSTWRSAPAEFTGGDPVATGEFVTEHDALELLLAELAELGTPYDVVVASTSFSNEQFPLPVISASGLRLATFTDRDVILVRQSSLGPGRIAVADSDTGTYGARLLVTVAGDPVEVPRGWAWADIEVRGRTLRFVTTHLEAYGSAPLRDEIRNPQARQLVEVIGESPHPVVLVGDVNVRPTHCRDERLGMPEWPADQNVVAYSTLEAAGLAEVWPTVHPDEPCGPEGWTSGQDSLRGAESTLDHRIDDVFVSDGFSVLDAEVVGDEQADRTPGGLWPSDHASTWAKLRLDAGKPSG